jgi:hypothetical protein
VFVPIAERISELGLVAHGARLDANLRSTKRHIVLEVLADDEPACIVKFPRRRGETFLENEGRLLATLQESNLGTDIVSAPKLLHQGQMFGRTFLVESFVPGGSPKTIPADPRTARSVIGWTADIAWQHRAGDLQSTINEMLARVSPSYPEIGALVSERVATVAALSPVIAHGDLSYHNLLIDGERIGVIDWEYGRVDGFPMADPIDYLLYDLYRDKRNYRVAAGMLFGDHTGLHVALLRDYCRQFGLEARALGTLVALYVLTKLDLLIRLEALRARTKSEELMAFLAQADLDRIGARLAAP